MVNWKDLIDANVVAVVQFANGTLSSREFQQRFSNVVPSQARFAVRHYGTTYARRLARKALSRQGIISSRN